MATEIYDINDIKRNENPSWLARFLAAAFGDTVGRAIWCFLWDIVGFFAKLFHYLTLPFMFFKFFGEARRKRMENNKAKSKQTTREQ